MGGAGAGRVGVGAGVAREVETGRFSSIDQVHDVMARYLGKFLDRKLQLDVTYGFHYQSASVKPVAADSPAVIYRASGANPFSLYDFENVPNCARQKQTTANGTVLDPMSATPGGKFGITAIG